MSEKIGVLNFWREKFPTDSHYLATLQLAKRVEQHDGPWWSFCRHHCWGIDMWRGLRLVFATYPWRFVESGRQEKRRSGMHGNNPINQSHVCTLLGFLGTNGSTVPGNRHELTLRSDLPFRFRGFIWPGVHHRRQCQSDIFRGWDLWLSLTFWLQGWVFCHFWFSGEHPGNSTWPAQFLKASKLWNLNVPQCWHIEINARCWKFMDTDTYLDYQLERLSFFLGIKKTCVYIINIYIDLNRITM